MRNPIFHFILRVLLLALFALGGFVSGSWLAIRQRRDALLTAFPSAPATSRPPLIAGTEGPFRTEEEAFTAVFSAHLEPDRLRRGFELSEALERLDAAQCAALVVRVAKLRRKECEELIGPLLARWNEIDAESVQAWARPYVERAFATGRSGDLDETVLLAWARADPERALAEALKSPQRESSRWLAISAAQALAGENAAAKIAKLAALPAGPLREQALAEGFKEWAKKDPASAYGRLALLAPGPDFERTRSEILKSWASKDPPAALAQVCALLPDLPPGLSGASLVNRIALNAGHKDARLALEWAVDLPESLRSEATTAALLAWAQKDAIAALDWARAHGVPLDARTKGATDGYLGQFGTGLLGAALRDDDSEKVLAWLRKLPADEDRGRLLAGAIRARPNAAGRALLGELPPAEQIVTVQAFAYLFSREDPDAILSWAQSLPPGVVREEAIAAVIASAADRFPEAIDSMIEKVASGPDRDAALRGHVLAQSDRDPAKAIEIAGRIGNHGMREQAFRIIANGWLQRDASAAEAWLASTPELAPETKAALLRSHHEWRADYGN